jgi:hypothetical protein
VQKTINLEAGCLLSYSVMYDPEDSHLRTHRRENLQSYLLISTPPPQNPMERKVLVLGIKTDSPIIPSLYTLLQRKTHILISTQVQVPTDQHGANASSSLGPITYRHLDTHVTSTWPFPRISHWHGVAIQLGNDSNRLLFPDKLTIEAERSEFRSTCHIS